MKKVSLLVVMLAISMAAMAQMSAERIMALAPKLPTVAEMIKYEKESSAPLHMKMEVSQPELYSKVNEAIKKAKEAIDADNEKNLAPSLKNKIEGSKVAGTNVTVSQVEGMSEAEKEAFAKNMAQNKMASFGISQSDMAKIQSGNYSEADAQALANKMVQQMSGGLTAEEIKMMENMSDEQRAAYMQKKGMTGPPKGKANTGVTPLIQKNVELDKKIKEVSDKVVAQRGNAKKQGRKIYDQKYRKEIEKFNAIMDQAIKEGAFSEKYTQEEAPKVKAAGAKYNKAAEDGWMVRCKFYEEYLPIWRNAVVSSMSICKNELLPLYNEKKAITDKLYALTQNPEYSMGASYPLIPANFYLECAEAMDDYGPFEED